MIFPSLDADVVLTKLSSVAGALVSMKFLSGTVTERLLTASAGALLAYIVSPHLASRIGLPEGFTGFLAGLFGMAVMSRLWEFIQTAPISDFWKIVLDFFKRISGGSK